MMNKWVLRLTGLLVVSLLVLLFLHNFLNPDVPDYIENGVSVQTQDGNGQLLPSALENEADTPELSLTSLEGLESDDLQADDANTPLEATPSVVALPEPELGLTSLEDRETVPVLSNPDSTKPHVWLQAGSFSERGNADKRAAILEAQGWSVDIESAVVKGKTYHRVYIGPLKQDQVNGYLKTLDKMGISAREINR